MNRSRISRRTLLSCAVAVSGGLLLPGCGGEDKELTKVRDMDPAQKAKDSMDFYRNSQKKGGKK